MTALGYSGTTTFSIIPDYHDKMIVALCGFLVAAQHSCLLDVASVGALTQLTALSCNVQLPPRNNRHFCSSSNFFRWKYLNFFGFMPYAFNRSSDIAGSLVPLFFFFFFFFFVLPAVLRVLVQFVLSGTVSVCSAITASFVRFLRLCAARVSSTAEAAVSIL